MTSRNISETASMHPVARTSVHILLCRENSVLVLLRENTGFCDGFYSVPAGHVEQRESIFDASIRELREETGVVVSKQDLKVVGITERHTTDSRVDFFLIAKNWKGEVENREPNKCRELRWCQPDDLPDAMIPFVRSAIENTFQNWMALSGSGAKRHGEHGALQDCLDQNSANESKIWFDSISADEAVAAPVEPLDFQYEAFLSFCSETDEKLVNKFYTELSKCGASPWQFWKWKNLDIYYDRERSRAGDELNDTIKGALNSSRYLILLASPDVVNRRWIDDELAWWLSIRTGAKILIVVVDGQISWDKENRDFDWSQTDCIPEALSKKYPEQHWIDERIDKTAPATLDSISVAARKAGAALLGLSFEKLSELQFSRKKRFWGSLVLLIAGLVMISGFFAWSYRTEIWGKPAEAHYNLGIGLLSQRRNSSQVRSALSEFNKALEYDQHHVPSLIGSAEALTLLIGYGASADPQADWRLAEQRLVEAERSGASNDPEYKLLMGRLQIYGKRDIRLAREYLVSALKDEPANLKAQHNLSATYTFLRQYERALEISRNALSLVEKSSAGRDDKDWVLCKVNLAWTLYHARQYVEAEVVCFDILRFDPTNDQANRYLGHIYTQTGKYSKALERYRRAGGDNIEVNRNLFANYSCALALNGLTEEASENIDRISNGEEYFSPYRLSQALVSLGMHDEAISKLEQARDQGDPFIVWAASDPLMSGLHGNPSYEAYLSKIGLGNANSLLNN